MNNIKDYRIRKSERLGFFVEKKEIYLVGKYRFFGCLFPTYKSEERWRVILRESSERIGRLHTLTFCAPNPPFKTKEEAIKWIEIECTPDKFYYPDKFDETINV